MLVCVCVRLPVCSAEQTSLFTSTAVRPPDKFVLVSVPLIIRSFSYIFLFCFSPLCLHFLSLSSPAVHPFITPFYPIKHTASWPACLFILNAYKPWTHALFLQQTRAHTRAHARTNHIVRITWSLMLLRVCL